MRLRTIRPRYVVFCGLIGLGCSLAISELCGQGPLHDRAPPPCVLDGPCLPNRATWGYYGPKWRRWPGTVAAPGLTGGEATQLPGTNVPAPETEDVRVPLPITPTPEGTTPGGETGVVPPSLEPSPAGVGPRVPTPAAPAPAPGGIGPGVFPAPLEDAPLPGAPLPNIAPPLPGDAAPQPGGLGPVAPNPFSGSSNEEPSELRLGEDPPPSLPPSLRSSRHIRDARRATDQTGTHPSFAHGLTRLPSPTSPSATIRGRYEVHQASATVWASGTDDIRPADPNAGRVQQAIHHEPVE